MGRWLHPVDRGQGCLLPADMRSWLPPGHLAWQVIEVTGELDLSGFAGAYRSDRQGQAPYDPAMMTGLLLYCYLKGIRSSRRIAAACVDDVGAIVICGGARPSHQAVAVFIRRHRAQVRGLFVQVLSLLAAAGAVAGQVAAVDGSPVSGSASRFANVTGDQLAERIAAVEAAIGAEADAWLAGAAGGQQVLPDGDEQEDQRPGGEGPGGGGGVVLRRLSALTAQLARLRAAQAALARRQAAPGSPAVRVAAATGHVAKVAARLAKAEAAQDAKMLAYGRALLAGKPWAGKRPVPASWSAKVARDRKNLATAQARLEKACQAAAAAAPVKVSATDPDCRLMPAKNGGFLQGWNLQLTAARRQILLAAELHDSPVDAGALVTMIEAALANCELAGLAGRIRAWLADNGYASAATFSQLSHLMLLVSVRNEAAQTGRAAATSAIPDGWQHMAARLATPAGKSLYRRRAGLVEPAFAQFFARFGRYLNYRGRDAADAEIKLLATAHNLAKLLDHRRRLATA